MGQSIVWSGPDKSGSVCGTVQRKVVQSVVRSSCKLIHYNGPDRSIFKPLFLTPPGNFEHCIAEILKIGLLHYKIFKWSIKLIHITKTSPYLKHLVHIKRFPKEIP